MKFLAHNVKTNPLEWEKVVGRKLHTRPVFIVEENVIQHSRVAIQLLGIDDNEYLMKEYIYTLANNGANWTMLFHNLPKLIDPNKRTEIVNILQQHQEKPLSLNRFMAFFAGKQLLPLMQTKYRDHFIDTLRQWLVFLQNKYPNFAGSQMQRIFLDFVKWSNHFFPAWLEKAPFESEMPTIMWFGQAKESEICFIYFLYLFGCDVVIIEPDGKNIMQNYGIADIPVYEYSKNGEMFEFPFDKPMQIQTITSRASEQVQEHLYNDSAINYPWKYAEYETRSRILNTTLDEVFILDEAEMYLRDGFESDGKTVYLPVLFTKIEGISQNKQEFAYKVKKVVNQRLTHTANEFPLLPYQKANMQFHMRDASTDGRLNPEKMIRLSIWPFKQLPIPAQLNVARTIIRLIDEQYIVKQPNQSQQQYEQYIFGQILLTPDAYIRLYQQFDYSANNPTLFIFKEENSEAMGIQDAVLIVFLSMLGFDVIICCPAGSLSIEYFITAQLLNTHRQDIMSFETTLESLLTYSAPEETTSKMLDFKRVISKFSKKFK